MKFYFLCFGLIYLFSKGAISVTDRAKEATGVLIDEVAISLEKFDNKLDEKNTD